ncbi:MAG: InlB B-repeat-containing protein [Firmicutes bacterium]|nr:InlB B-repeat-containing protein [Bacillota bacterium]
MKIICPECSIEMQDSESRCPNCGCPKSKILELFNHAQKEVELKAKEQERQELEAERKAREEQARQNAMPPNISVDYIKNVASYWKIYNRGFDYYNSGRVRDFSYSKDYKTFSAKVAGKYLYTCQVQIKNDKVENFSCSCPFDLGNHFCKHLVAVLLCIRAEFLVEHEKKEAKKKEEQRNRLQKNLEAYRERKEKEKQEKNPQQVQNTTTNYYIYYVLFGGTVNGNPSSYTANDTITLRNPTRTGYTFTGWSGTGINGKSMNVKISKSTGNRAFTANWESNRIVQENNPRPQNTGSSIANRTTPISAVHKSTTQKSEQQKKKNGLPVGWIITMILCFVAAIFCFSLGSCDSGVFEGLVLLIIGIMILFGVIATASNKKKK